MAADNKRDNEDYLVIAETRALQFILQYPEHIAEFRPSMFVHKTACALYGAINYLQATKQTVDAQAITQVANKEDARLNLAVVKSLLFPAEPVTFVPADRELLVADLAKAETRKATLAALQEAVALADAPTDGSEEYFTQLNRKITEASLAATKHKHTTLITMEELFHTYDQELEERAKGERFLSGDLLLDKALVRKTAGGQIISIIGATGSGKSAFSLNLFNGFLNLDEPAIFFTLEMDAMSTADRLAALRTGMPIKDWYDVDKISNLRSKLRKEVETLKGLRCELVDDPSLTLADINAVIAEFRVKHNVPDDHRVVVFIDLITQVRDFATGPRSYSMAGSYEVAMNAANVLVKQQNACIIATAQYNREVDSVRLESFEDLQETRPHSLNSIKNSHAIAERSRVVLSTWRPKYYAERYLPDAPQTEVMDDIMEVSVLKQSQGEVGQRLNYMFEGPTMTLTPTAEGALPTFDEAEDRDEVDQDVARSLNQVHF